MDPIAFVIFLPAQVIRETRTQIYNTTYNHDLKKVCLKVIVNHEDHECVKDYQSR